MGSRTGAAFAAAIAFAATLTVAPPPAAAAEPDLTERFVAEMNQTAYHDSWAPESLTSPLWADVDGDGRNEVVFGGMDGRLVVFSSSGQFERSITIGPGNIHGTPAFGDLNGDGVGDLAIGTTHGDLVAVTGTGTELFRKRTCTYPGKPCDNYSSPAIVDLDGDGDNEVVASSDDHYLHAWHHDGSYVTGYPVYVFDTTWSSPTIADLDGDGFPEIALAVDVDYITGQHVGCGFGGILRVHEHTGEVKWQVCLPGEIPMGNPAIADIDGDGVQEIVIGAGYHFSAQGEPERPSRLLHAFDANGDIEPGWPVDTGGITVTSPSIGQLDDDGAFEIVTTTGTGHVIAYEHTGAEKWRRCLLETSSCPGPYKNAVNAPVAIADVDNDGRQEVVARIEFKLNVLDGRSGTTEDDITPDGNYVPRGQPVVVSHDNEALILTLSLDERNGQAGRNAGDVLVMTAVGTNAPRGRADWARARQNLAGTGSFETTWSEPAWIEPWLEAVYADLLGRPLDDGGQTYWTGRLRSGASRGTVARQLAGSNEWAGTVIDDLYADVLDRIPDAEGRAYWISRLQAGMRVADIAAFFLASDEYYDAAGGTNDAYIRTLYLAILDRPVDGDGLEYWVGRLDTGTSRTVLSRLLYLSMENGRQRVDSLYRAVLDRGADASGREYWAGQLVDGHALDLTARLVASQEYLDRSAQRFG